MFLVAKFLYIIQSDTSITGRSAEPTHQVLLTCLASTACGSAMRTVCARGTHTRTAGENLGLALGYFQGQPWQLPGSTLAASRVEGNNLEVVDGGGWW